jgi:hypothetical protein
MNPILIVSISIIVFLLFVWIGLRIQPKPFSQPTFAVGETLTMSLPDNLPSPVKRFFQTVYGNQIPIIKSVVITGRGWIRLFKIWLPTRFIFIHEAGVNYRHYFEATFFGLPFLKVNEGIINGASFFESPMGTYFNDPNTNQGANLALWAEGGWFPSSGSQILVFTGRDWTTLPLFFVFPMKNQQNHSSSDLIPKME